MLVGKGRHTYEWVGDWCKLPAGVTFGNTHGVAEDAQGRIIIHNQSENAVAFFDPGGRFIKSWGREFKDGAHGLTLHREGNTEYLYLADYARHIVVKTTLDGETVMTLQWPKECPAYTSADQYKPTNTAIAANGDIYVADGYGLFYIHQYDARGKYLRSWGGKDDSDPKREGKLNCPHGITIDTRGGSPLILVADRSNVRLQYFTLDGKFVRQVTEELRHPCHFDQRDGDLLIPDLFGRVTIFDHSDKLVAHLGDNPEPTHRANNGLPRDQWRDGAFIAPHAGCWDRAGNVFVVEWVVPGRVTKLKRMQG